MGGIVAGRTVVDLPMGWRAVVGEAVIEVDGLEKIRGGNRRRERGKAVHGYGGDTLKLKFWRCCEFSSQQLSLKRRTSWNRGTPAQAGG